MFVTPWTDVYWSCAQQPQGFISAKVLPPRQPQIKWLGIGKLQQQLFFNHKRENCQASLVAQCPSRHLENLNLHTLSVVLESITICFWYSHNIFHNHYSFTYYYRHFSSRQNGGFSSAAFLKICWKATYSKDIFFNLFAPLMRILLL